jgi:hypothetical protein
VEAAALIVNFVKIYAAMGGLVAIAFLIFGIDRIDHAAQGSYAFRPLLAPGLMLLWPLVIWRWLALKWRGA